MPRVALGAQVDHDLVWKTLESALLGLALAFVVYRGMHCAAYSLRLIDLASFSLGFVALVGALFAAYSSRGALLENVDRLIVRSTILDISFDTTVSTLKICHRVKHTPYRPSVRNKEECDRLRRYVESLAFDPITPSALRIPDAEDYSDPKVRSLAHQTFARVDEANKLIEGFVRDRQTRRTTEALDGLVREISLPIVAFAFGLGAGRRTIDLYLVLPQQQKLSFDRWFMALKRLLRRTRRRIRLAIISHR
jgi:hypothetical protein